MKGHPFIPIRETMRTITFLSTDFIAHEDGHLLVIPKEHFAKMELETVDD